MRAGAARARARWQWCVPRPLLPFSLRLGRPRPPPPVPPSKHALHCAGKLLQSASLAAGARPSTLERVQTSSTRRRLHLLPEPTGATAPGPTRSLATSRLYALPPEATGGPGPPTLVFVVDAATEPAELVRARLLDRSTSMSAGARLPDRSTSTSAVMHASAGRWRSAWRRAPTRWRRQR
jgi:hypothetical protein